jgi:hypothetical protein
LKDVPANHGCGGDHGHAVGWVAFPPRIPQALQQIARLAAGKQRTVETQTYPTSYVLSCSITEKPKTNYAFPELGIFIWRRREAHHLYEIV